MTEENKTTGASTPTFPFAERVVAITGGTSGIGFAIAQRFLLAGASVVIVGSSMEHGCAAEERLLCSQKEQQLPNEPWFLQGDVSAPTDMARVMSRIQQRYGHLETVVCSAGLGRKARLLNTTPDDLTKLFQVNVHGAIYTVQAAADLLSASGGSVVLVSSDAGITGEPQTGAYSVSKAALNMAGKMLALDLAAAGVRVNVVAPGDIVPGMRSMLRPGETLRPADDFLSWKLPPLRRYGQAQEIAEVVLFLASPQASFMTGAVVPVDGGMRAGLEWE